MSPLGPGPSGATVENSCAPPHKYSGRRTDATLMGQPSKEKYACLRVPTPFACEVVTSELFLAHPIGFGAHAHTV